jgi:hypothetical protein
MEYTIVKQGGIIIEGVEIARESDHAILALFDLRAKRADVMWSQDINKTELIIYKIDETLHAESDIPTVVTINELGDGWHVQASVGRYTLSVFAIKEDPAWRKERL